MPSPERIASQNALDMYQNCTLNELATRAAEVRQQLHPGLVRTYVVERNINYTNICQCKCSFCAFNVSPKHELAYVLDHQELYQKIDELIDIGGTQILLQGGLNPELPFTWYEHTLQAIASRYPKLHIHAFSPVEINFFAQHYDMTITQVIERLRTAGLKSIPGAGAEILSDRVRRLVSPAKCTTDQWLDVMRTAHQLGMCTTATMMFGHAETIPERIEHLDRLRTLQDESLTRRDKDPDAGFFTAFTCWPFQPGHTPLARRLQKLSPVGPAEYLRTEAIARLHLDNFANIQTSWVTLGGHIGQLSLAMGANDMGSLMMEENVVAAAGTHFHFNLDQLRSLIRNAGYQPHQRDYYYNLLPAT